MWVRFLLAGPEFFIKGNKMKADKNYRMSKSLKRSLALSTFKSKEQRDAWKRAMIGAEVVANAKVKMGDKKDRKQN